MDFVCLWRVYFYTNERNYLKMILIALDDGHGINTPGKRTPKLANGKVVHENAFNRSVVKFLDIALKRCKMFTLLVAPGDDDTPLSARVKMANDAKASAYISIHYDASDGVFNGNDPEGHSVHYYPGDSESMTLAALVMAQLIMGTKQKSRGIKASNFQVLRETDMPAILSENGFMDNEYEAGLMLNVDFQKEVAEEHCKAICEYFKMEYIPELVTKPITPKTECSSWAVEAWKWAEEKCLLDGKRPKDVVTREELALVMYRLYQMID